MSKRYIYNPSLGKHYDTTGESYWKGGKAHWYMNYYWKEHGHTLLIATVSDDSGVVTDVTNYLGADYLKRAREKDQETKSSGLFNDDYEDPEDFWYDHADEFDGYEDAWDYRYLFHGKRRTTAHLHRWRQFFVILSARGMIIVQIWQF